MFGKKDLTSRSLPLRAAWSVVVVVVMLASLPTATALALQRPKSETACSRRLPIKHAVVADLDSTGSESDNRRSFLAQSTGLLGALLMASTATPPAALASEVRAPLEVLRPATRVRLYLEQLISLCQDAVKASTNSQDKTIVFKPLADLLLGPDPVFLQPGIEESLSRRYLEIDTSKAWQAARLKDRERKGAERGVAVGTLNDKVNTSVQQWQLSRQWQILRQRQQTLESKNPLRAALNAYTNNLVFGDNYQLNAQGELRKSLIRNDALPDVHAVVVSDLDLRDLYRNQFLQNMDDARAELAFQRDRVEEPLDPSELLRYLRLAQTALDEWFAFIPPDDVAEARKSVLAE